MSIQPAELNVLRNLAESTIARVGLTEDPKKCRDLVEWLQ
jgi:hypothetical protein